MKFVYTLFKILALFITILQSGWCTSNDQDHPHKYVKQGSDKHQFLERDKCSTIFNYFIGSCDSGSVNNAGQRLTILTKCFLFTLGNIMELCNSKWKKECSDMYYVFFSV